jgi:hypothetical protein
MKRFYVMANENSLMATLLFLLNFALHIHSFFISFKEDWNNNNPGPPF